MLVIFTFDGLLKIENFHTFSSQDLRRIASGDELAAAMKVCEMIEVSFKFQDEHLHSTLLPRRRDVYVCF